MKMLIAIAAVAISPCVARAQNHTSPANPKILKAAGAVDSLAWSPGSSTLAVQSKPRDRKQDRARTIQLWDTATARVMRTLSQTADPKFSVSISPDGKSLACAVWREPGAIDISEIWQWNLKTGERGRTLSGAKLEGLGVPFTSDTLSISFSPDGQLLAACGKLVSAGDISGQHIGGEVCIFDLRTGEMKWHSRTTHTDIVYAVAFSPDGNLLVSAGMDKLIRVWDPQTGELKKTLSGAGWEGISSLTFSSDGTVLVSGGRGFEEGGVVRVWDIQSGRVLHRFKEFEANSDVRVAAAPKSPIVFAVAQAGDQKRPMWHLRSWDVSTGQSIGVLDEREGAARAIDVSSDGKFVAVGTWEGEVLLYKVSDGL